MTRRISTLVLITILLLGGFYSLRGDQKNDKVDQLFKKWDKKDSPGCAIAIIKKGKIIYEKGYGMADLERDVLISPVSMFDIASTSKQFVAACILLLEEQGKLSLDQDIHKYFPTLPDYGSKITIRHLIHHTSGIRDYLALMSLAGMPFANDYPEEMMVDLICRQKALNFKPGEEHLYSNSGYFLLGEIVRQVSGKSLGKFARENIFKPLGMQATHFYDDYTRIVKNRAIGYVPRGKKGYRTSLYLFDLVGDGGVLTNVEEMFLWDQNFYNNKLGKGSPEFLNKMHRVGILNSGKKLTYACGLGVSTYKGLKMVSHSGGWAGYRAQLIRFPEQRFSVVCLANVVSVNPTVLCRKIADIYLLDQFTDTGKRDKSKSKSKPEFIVLSLKTLESRAGHYRNIKTGTTWQIRLKDRQLEVKAANGYVFKIAPLSRYAFKAVGTPVEIKVTFLEQKKKKGQSRLKIDIEGREPAIYAAYQPVELNPSQLNEYSGKFFSEELGVVYKIGVEDKILLARIRYVKEGRRLIPTVTDEFVASGAVVKFQRDSRGAVTGFSVNAGRVKNISFVKQK